MINAKAKRGLAPFVFDCLEWRKGLQAEGPDDSVSRGWIPNRLAIPTLLEKKTFVKAIFEMIDLASPRKRGQTPFRGLTPFDGGSFLGNFLKKVLTT